MPHGVGEIDSLSRPNVTQIRSAVQWHSSLFSFLFYTNARKFSTSSYGATFAFFLPLFHTTCQKSARLILRCHIFSVNFCVFIVVELFFKINFSHVFNLILSFFKPVIYLWLIELSLKIHLSLKKLEIKFNDSVKATVTHNRQNCLCMHRSESRQSRWRMTHSSWNRVTWQGRYERTDCISNAYCLVHRWTNTAPCSRTQSSNSTSTTAIGTTGKSSLPRTSSTANICRAWTQRPAVSRSFRVSRFVTHISLFNYYTRTVFWT